VALLKDLFFIFLILEQGLVFKKILKKRLARKEILKRILKREVLENKNANTYFFTKNSTTTVDNLCINHQAVFRFAT
jgi:hypothetical protein